MKKEEIKLTKEEIIILQDLCIHDLLTLRMAKYNKFTDKTQLNTYENKLKEIMQKLSKNLEAVQQ